MENIKSCKRSKKIKYFFFSHKNFLKLFPKTMLLKHPLNFSLFFYLNLTSFLLMTSTTILRAFTPRLANAICWHIQHQSLKKSPLPGLVNPKKFTSPLEYHPKYTSVQQHNPKSQILIFIPNLCSFSLFGVSTQSSTLPLSTTIQSKLLPLITSLFGSQWWIFSDVGSGMGQVIVWVVGIAA